MFFTFAILNNAVDLKLKMEITGNKVGSIGNKEIVLFKITNNKGHYVELLNYGATLVSITVPDMKGQFGNIILNYKRISDYFSDKYYIGSTVGPFANRIANAFFTIDGTEYFLDKNDGNNNNHSGFSGFNKKIFDYQIEHDRLILTTCRIDGESGFPGNMEFSITYQLTDNNELIIIYSAISDKKTLFSPTCHPYFNLSAHRPDILSTELKINANQYLENNVDFIPTGSVLDVENTAFDFRDDKIIGRMMSLKKETITGYNTYFITKKEAGAELSFQAMLSDKETGRKLEIYSTYPGIMLYTGDYLDSPFHPFQGLALEPQHYPDSPNQENFPSCVIDAGKLYQQTIKYKFVTETSANL